MCCSPIVAQHPILECSRGNVEHIVPKRFMKGRQEQHDNSLVWRSMQLKQNGAAKMAQAFNIMLSQVNLARFNRAQQTRHFKYSFTGFTAKLHCFSRRSLHANACPWRSLWIPRRSLAGVQRYALLICTSDQLTNTRTPLKRNEKRQVFLLAGPTSPLQPRGSTGSFLVRGQWSPPNGIARGSCGVASQHIKPNRSKFNHV